MSRSEQAIQSNLERVLKSRKRLRLPFFLSEFPAFFIFLFISYGGILFVSYILYTSSTPSTSFIISRFWIQRAIGICNLSAFISFWVQVYFTHNTLYSIITTYIKKAHGLIGENGIKPIKQQLAEVEHLANTGKLSVSKYEYMATLFWISSSDIFLHCICLLGVLCSILIIIPIYISTTPLFILCAICYGSIKTVGAEFMQLQWDSMLIETNIICLWFELDALFTLRFGSDIYKSDTYSSYKYYIYMIIGDIDSN